MQEIYGVYPGSDEYSHEVVISAGGKKYGLRLLNGVSSVRIVPPKQQPPPVKLQQNSWHMGRGIEVWTPNANNVYDTMNAWDATPNKLHPAPLMRWYTGFRDAEMNMPDSGKTHKWVPLYPGSGSDPNTRYLDVKFTASASTNRERCFLILRTKGTPTDLTVEWCANSSGNPGSASKTITKAASVLGDIVSYYVEFKPSSVLAVTSGTDYHIKLYGGSGDTPNKCWEVLCDAGAAGLKSTDNSSWSATTYSPYYRITDADINQRIFMFTLSNAWYAVTSPRSGGNSQLYIFGCRGKATSGTSTTLTDTGAGQYGGSFPNFAGYKIHILRGTGRGQVRTIASNTTTAITVTLAFDITPDTTSEYYIYGGSRVKEITGHGLGWVSSKPVYANGTVYFPQADTTDIRIMQLNYANANDHGFDAENTKHNQAYFLCPSYDPTLGPILVRGNNSTTSAGNPAGKPVSIGKGATSPGGTALVFGTDVTFGTSIFTGDNTFNITGVYDKENQVLVAKEDVLYQLNGNIPIKISYGADASPNIHNGEAACVAADGIFYITAENDVLFLSGGNSYPTNLPFNLPSGRSGYVREMVSEKGWLFGALDAGDSGVSSIMRMTLQDRSWHEQIRGVASGRRIRNVAWLNFTETRPHMAFECGGELLYQEMPLFGVRPQQDTGMLYQHEAAVEFPTIDMLSTDPKFFSYIEIHSKNLADSVTAAAYGREIALDYQLNDQIGKTSWVGNAGSFGISPIDKTKLNLGSQFKIRPRLRIENNDPSNPPVIENFGLSLFTRVKQYSSVMLDLNGELDEDVSGEELYGWLVDRIVTADVVQVESIFSFLHNKRMVMPAEPNSSITNLDPETGFSAVLNLYLEYLPE